ncbi:carbohydrate ABC transporter permease [Streptomyces mirabilis]|jgi:N-acetylglucosamine transport system permease protein|uniref:Sugar ABC transporter permease n=1 Tax=Streptomyces olivochromogenes TaxID=1963 RepID=A0A250VI32_STROL|nr:MULTISPECIES: sugar ABC transporter permease [Streptomyces]KUN43636.1 ABC transporter permease [Streptomyces olivochromogenes]MCT9111037.1 sugar ABC transporter permease [Streptomyces mirabilis]MCX4437223.1 sugar ABC transporter permease [Streptomyces mirabilis]PBC95521.1 N-acetylglucosamine ABC transporter membrane protein /chitobiose ABC transporter membrane protein [Streptomyces sp. Ag82_O1-15]SOE62240.1 N-acetylglucosamine ABC transporter membrane protein /chitobiose ABC transporter mem
MQHGKYRFIVGFLVAPLALYAIFVIWPFVQAIYYSFTDWTGLSPDFKMVGFANYTRMLHDDIFWKSLQHSLLFALLLPLVTLGLALFFAFMLNVGGRRRKGAAITGVRGSGFYKIAYFFPQVLSIAIVSLLFQFAYNPNDGVINGTLKAIGLGSVQPDWLGDPNLALWCVMAVLLWSTVGFFVVLFSAGMASIPKDFYEAALLDGASRATTFFKITLPLLWDTVQSGWVYMGILALGAEAFAAVQIMTVGPGGPDYSTTVLPLYVYQSAFRDANAAYATTIGVALLIVTLLFAAIVMRLGRRERLEF